MHPHDKELAEKTVEERLRFEEAFLSFTVAARIQNLLEDLGVSKAELARRLGKSQAWVSKVLSGRQNLTLNSLARVGLALGVRWNPEMLAAPREGTHAAQDRPLPAWVRAENEIRFETPDYVGAFETSQGADPGPLVVWALGASEVSMAGELPVLLSTVLTRRASVSSLHGLTLEGMVAGENQIVNIEEGAVSGA